MGTTASTRCAWCGDDLARGSPLRGRTRCAACGVATAVPWPTEEELERAYRGAYRPASGRFAGPGDALLRRLRASLAGRIDRIAPPGPVVDVGAGDGALVDALARRGRDVIGLERDAAPPRVRAGTLADLDGRWAAVVFWHSLEHLRAPGEALAQAARLLAPRGVVVVAMPDAASLQARAFGDRWFALDPPRHLVHVPKPALLARLAELGLRVERDGRLRGGQVVFGWLHGLVGLLPGDLDLYDAVRRPDARARPLSLPRRAAALAAAALLSPAAAAAALAEAAVGRSGSLYVEARRG